jgi:hypothetical protein
MKNLSLVEGGVINPCQWQLDRVKQEVSNLLKIKIEEIESIECWLNQICVKILGKGSKFLSYRSLSMWFEECLLAIENCQDVIQFEKIGVMLRYEMEKYDKYYPPEKLAKLQQFWSEKSPRFDTEESRLQLRIVRQQEAEKWLRYWQQLLSNCQNKELLDRYYWKIHEESQEFEDLWETIKCAKDLWEQQRLKLDRPNDFWMTF